ncbi:MAG TPA: response regulator transcription factor [Patescibacteria group bacterium]|nr:response regulator transcription factor [Patescibacteria group bacterium]
MNKTLLIIEDDKNLQQYLQDLLIGEGYSVKALSDGIKALETIETIHPDLVVLDLVLPTVKGESVCKDIKKDYPELPVIILTGKDTVSDKINALELGADDYITKPFIAEELILRIKARLKENRPGHNLVEIADLAMNLDSMEVKRGPRAISLTPQEYKLLETLVVNKDKVLSREALLNKIWPNSFDIETRVVDVYISYLRKKIDRGFRKKLIHSVRGFGYVLKDS